MLVTNRLDKELYNQFKTLYHSPVLVGQKYFYNRGDKPYSVVKRVTSPVSMLSTNPRIGQKRIMGQNSIKKTSLKCGNI
jgi:hypothetical protein